VTVNARAGRATGWTRGRWLGAGCGDQQRVCLLIDVFEVQVGNLSGDEIGDFVSEGSSSAEHFDLKAAPRTAKNRPTGSVPNHAIRSKNCDHSNSLLASVP
jgi:hypothetical protein